MLRSEKDINTFQLESKVFTDDILEVSKALRSHLWNNIQLEINWSLA